MNSKKIFNNLAGRNKFVMQALALLVCFAFLASATFAQQTASGTQIRNQASASYSDGTNTYTTVSNTVTVTVAKVSGLKIEPDETAGTASLSVVPGQSGVLYSLRVTNLGNFSDQVLFLAGGGSIKLTGSGTVAAAVIDVDGSGTINTGDTDIFGNGSDVTSASIAQNGFIDVLVSVNISAGATPGSAITVQLGDATGGTPYDNQAVSAASPSNEVRTVDAASVNGRREARGDKVATVASDAQLTLTLTADPGPVAPATQSGPGGDINYVWQVCNPGARAAQSITLINGPAGSNSGVFIIAPIPVGTALKSGQPFPAGTLYSTTALTTSPLSATYTTTPPANLADVKRIAFNTGATLAAGGACSASFPMKVVVTTTNATLDIFEIGDAFATNSVGGQLTDQSGDAVAGKGDGNADFNEPKQGDPVSPTQGFQQRTVLARTGAIFIGPSGKPEAYGPTNQNDDYTNRSLRTEIAGLSWEQTTATPGTIVFTNTLYNVGTANDTFVISVPSAPSGFTVRISTDGGTSYTTMTPGSGGNSVSLALNFGATGDIRVEVTAPTGTQVLATNGFPVTIRAASTLTPSAYNETIDRLYTGFVKLEKSYVVINGTGVGGATDAVPGADIEYTITYTNIASTGGTDSSSLTVSNLVITEDGAAAPNNWATYTSHVASPAPSDSNGGAIVLSNGDTKLVDTVPTLAPQASGTFKFRRKIN